jgi:hypothetical protein
LARLLISSAIILSRIGAARRHQPEIATATRIGTAFYAFGLILLPVLSFVGFATSNRVPQYGIEELE